MSRPENLENLRALADQLVWAIEEYVKAGIDDMKGDGWVPNDATLRALGLVNAHESIIFPESTDLTVTVTAHANIDEWGAWVELVDSAANTLSSKFASNDGHVADILIESTESAGQIWALELAYGDTKISCGRKRFVSASVGFVPATQQTRIRAPHIPAGEAIYGRLMCDKAGAETCMIHVRYFLHPA